MIKHNYNYFFHALIMCEIFIEMLHISLYNLALIGGLYPVNKGLYVSIKI